MASRYEVEVTVTSAKDLKNVNWRYGRLKPYVVVWVEPNNKCTTRVDDEGDMFPYWDQKLVIPFNSPIDDSTLHIDVVHANAAEDTKPIIGSARLSLRDVDVGERATRKLDLKRPSGRPHGKVEVKVAVRENRYRAPDPYYAPSYGVPPPTSRDYSAPPAYGNAYGAPAPTPYQSAPPAGYPPYSGGAPSYGKAQPSYGEPAYGQGSYGQTAPAYGQGSYGQTAPAYGQDSYGQPKQEKKSKFGMGTGLAVGAVAGVLGGLALVEGVDYVEDKIADNVEDRVDNDEDGGYDDDDY